MSLRVKLLAVFTLAVAASVGLMAWGVERYARQQFQESDRQRSYALVAQFRRELLQRGTEVSSRVQSIADAESTLRMVMDLNRAQADPSVYAHDARGLAASRQLDFLELVGGDGTLISSAQWPERVGYKNDWVTQGADWNHQSAFVDRVESPDTVRIGLLAVRMVHVGERNFYIIGGQKLDSDFLRSLALPAGMRALFYRNLEEAFVPSALSDAAGPVADAEPLAPLIKSLQKTPRDSAETIQWTTEPGSAERFVSLPLTGRRGELLGALLLGSAQDQLMALVDYIRGLALGIAAAGILLGFVVSWWIGARVTRPLARLASGLDDVTAGDWDTHVEGRSSQEIGKVGRAFNKMTSALADERAGHLARERVASWRELAGQLAGELNTELSPLQAAVENLGRAREQTPERFDEVFFESLAALREKLTDLRATAGQLSDFASLPAPRLQAVSVNDAVRAAVKSFEPKFSAIGRPPITPELHLDEKAAVVRADPALLQKAVENILLHALEDMPAGGMLTIRTRQQDGMVHMVISDTGLGCELTGEGRIFSSYRAARGAGAGLGLATVQSIVSDLRGRISMESAPGAGTTFYLDLPVDGSAPASKASPQPKKALPEAAPPALEVEATPEVTPEAAAPTTFDGVEASVPEAEPAPVEMQAEAQLAFPIEPTEPVAVHEEVAEETREEDHAETTLPATPGIPPEVAAQLLAGLSAEGADNEIEVAEAQADVLSEALPEALPEILHEEQPASAEEPLKDTRENPPAETEEKETWRSPLTYH